MSEVDPAARWDQAHRAATQTIPEPAQVLVAYAHLLPESGRALDFACGLGGNALFLARHGLDTTAWDLSAMALERLAAAASREALAVRIERRDLETDPYPAAGFGVIVVSRFLCRARFADLLALLAPGGLLYYQTFTTEKPAGIGPRNPDYLLRPGELLRLAAGLRIVAYREEGFVGDTERGWRNEAFLVARAESGIPAE